jgi:hypothetical protein
MTTRLEAVSQVLGRKDCALRAFGAFQFTMARTGRSTSVPVRGQHEAAICSESDFVGDFRSLLGIKHAVVVNTLHVTVISFVAPTISLGKIRTSRSKYFLK